MRVVTWISLGVVEVKVVLGEGLQAALVVTEGVVAPRPGGHHSVCHRHKESEGVVAESATCCLTGSQPVS